MRRILRPAWVVPLLVLVVVASWWSFRPRPAPESAPRVERETRVAARDLRDLRDLEGDERTGGHTLARHVGRSDEQLALRLSREPRLAAASTFLDRASAQRAVTAALEADRNRIRTWLESGRRTNLVVRWDGDGRPIGKVLRRGATGPVAASAARIVLRRRGDGYFVLTAYPEVLR